MSTEQRAINYANLEKDALVQLLLKRDEEIEEVKRKNRELEVCGRLNKAYESLEIIIDMRKKSKEQIRNVLFGVPAEAPETEKLQKINDFEIGLRKAYDTFDECKESTIITAFWAYPHEENRYKALWDDCVRKEISKKKKSFLAKGIGLMSRMSQAFGCGPERKMMTIQEIAMGIDGVVKNDGRVGATDAGGKTAKVADARKGTTVKSADISGGAAGGSSTGLEATITSTSKSLLEEINATTGTSNKDLGNLIDPPGQDRTLKGSVLTVFPPAKNFGDFDTESD